MGFFSDFKASLMKGDVLSLATAVVIGGAFGKIVGSAVDDVIMPIVGLLTGGIDFTTKFISLDGNSYADLAAAKAAGAAVITYGNLVQAIINFVIISFFIFVVLRAAEKMKKKELLKMIQDLEARILILETKLALSPSVTKDSLDSLTYECYNGNHEYPNPWMSITPPHCKKCGKQALQTTLVSGVGAFDPLKAQIS